MAALAIVLTVSGAPFGARAAGTSREAVPAKAPKLDAVRFETELASRMQRVEEFRFLEENARRLGLRVWLFGGTAASYAHYVKQDLLRELGDGRFQKDRFDYEYWNIYRSTQDLDIMIDGTPEQAERLEALLREKYPHLQGSVSAWEVRTLHHDRGAKERLFDAPGKPNPNMLNQHTDSHSTGLIELTAPPEGESRIRDFRQWGAKTTRFFKDVLEGRLHYYFSPLHETTSRYIAGKNPPIFSAVRYLTKAFQYELKIPKESEENLKRVIQGFSGAREIEDAEAARWIEKHGKKLYQHAVSLEYAEKELDRFGLRRTLIGLGDPKAEDTLAWLLNRKALPSFKVGQGNGPTAADLGITEVAHETRDFLAYESITRAHTGVPNVFESRQNAVGENAFHGDGFYTAVGRKGAAGTGITIRFKVRPEARLGKDFIVPEEALDPRTGKIRSEGYVLFRNRGAFEVIPESLDLTPLQYFGMLAEGAGVDADDKGILHKFKKRLTKRLRADPRELQAISELVLAHHWPDEGATGQELRRHGSGIRALYSEWLEVIGVQDALKLIQHRARGTSLAPQLLLAMLATPESLRMPGFFELLSETQALPRSFYAALFEEHPHWRRYVVEKTRLQVESGGTSATARRFLQAVEEHWKVSSVEDVLTSADPERSILRSAGSPEKEYVELLRRKATTDPQTATAASRAIKKLAAAARAPLDGVAQRTFDEAVRFWLSVPESTKKPGVVRDLLLTDPGALALRSYLNEPEWAARLAQWRGEGLIPDARERVQAATLKTVLASPGPPGIGGVSSPQHPWMKILRYLEYSGGRVAEGDWDELKSLAKARPPSSKNQHAQIWLEQQGARLLRQSEDPGQLLRLSGQLDPRLEKAFNVWRREYFRSRWVRYAPAPEYALGGGLPESPQALGKNPAAPAPYVVYPKTEGELRQLLRGEPAVFKGWQEEGGRRAAVLVATSERAPELCRVDLDPRAKRGPDYFLDEVGNHLVRNTAAIRMKARPPEQTFRLLLEAVYSGPFGSFDLDRELQRILWEEYLPDKTYQRELPAILDHFRQRFPDSFARFVRDWLRQPLLVSSPAVMESVVRNLQGLRLDSDHAAELRNALELYLERPEWRAMAPRWARDLAAAGLAPSGLAAKLEAQPARAGCPTLAAELSRILKSTAP